MLCASFHSVVSKTQLHTPSLLRFFSLNDLPSVACVLQEAAALFRKSLKEVCLDASGSPEARHSLQQQDQCAQSRPRLPLCTQARWGTILYTQPRAAKKRQQAKGRSSPDLGIKGTCHKKASPPFSPPQHLEDQ